MDDALRMFENRWLDHVAGAYKLAHGIWPSTSANVDRSGTAVALLYDPLRVTVRDWLPDYLNNVIIVVTLERLGGMTEAVIQWDESVVKPVSFEGMLAEISRTLGDGRVKWLPQRPGVTGIVALIEQGAIPSVEDNNDERRQIVALSSGSDVPGDHRAGVAPTPDMPLGDSEQQRLGTKPTRGGGRPPVFKSRDEFERKLRAALDDIDSDGNQLIADEVAKWFTIKLPYYKRKWRTEAPAECTADLVHQWCRRYLNETFTESVRRLRQ
jgi:hypothetical protein